MALVMHPTPVDGPRRSPRIRTAVTRRTLSRSRGADLPLAATQPALVPAHKTSAASTAPSSSRTRTLSRKKAPASASQASPSLSIRAGTKRKRSPNSPDHGDRPARPAYELVPRPSDADDEVQTPRQLRYAKRQRLLTSRPGKENPAVDASSGRKIEDWSGSRERLHRASTEGRLLTPQSSIATCNPQSSSPSPTDATHNSRADEKAASERPLALRLQAAAPSEEVSTDVTPPDVSASRACALDLAEPEDPVAPTITTLYRLPHPSRDRRPDTTDQSLWKLACQERVEYLKDVYREVFDAVLRAEASCRQTPADKAADPKPVQAAPQAEFQLYTPSTCTQERLDADVDMDVGYSSDWDSDEDDDDDDDDDMLLDSDSDSDAPTYDALVALDGTASTPFGSHGPDTPKLPRLSSIRVYALEAVPEQTGRNGVPFMGRGTPVDKQRRADWAAPARPPLPAAMRFVSQPWSSHSSPPSEYFSPSPELPFQQPGMQVTAGMEMGMAVGYDSAMQVDVQVQVQMPVPTATTFGMTASVVPQMEQAYGQQQECLSWLDPALRAESMSPSPSPAPTSVASYSPAVLSPMQDYPAHTPSPDLSISSASSSLSSLGSPSPTGCAWHATFLQCLQSPGCAPFFAPPSPSPAPSADAYVPVPPPIDPVPVPVPVPVAPFSSGGIGMFPNPELAQFVRSHLVPGSVTLSHALG
ncbi:hypothetical protein C8T65DRAFT_647421 [Cerioporus squamosus]|nr:hypothetical protein C8T65DRAFT_647421 [Cerioporus squamosus]